MRNDPKKERQSRVVLHTTRTVVKLSLMSAQNKSEWFLAVGDQSVGPLTASEVYERIVRGEASWVSFVWKEGMPEWTRVSDVSGFESLMPKAPVAKPGSQPPKPPGQTKTKSRDWFLYHSNAQHGPFAEDEVIGMVQVGSTGSDVYAWKDGMKDWEPLSLIPAFKAYAKTPVTPGAGAAEKRAHARRPLIAKVMIAEGSKVFVGMCRDVSIGGMQVMSEYVPQSVGAKLKLNISPPDLTKAAFQAFVAEGTVVRILDDRRGFSFRFSELPAATRTVIERIIAG